VAHLGQGTAHRRQHRQAAGAVEAMTSVTPKIAGRASQRGPLLSLN